MGIKLDKSKYTILLIVSVLFVVSSNLNWNKNHWQGIIKSDAKGYYAYLPAVFIYNDLNFSFFDKIDKEKYYNENLYYDYRSGANGKTISKYYCGTALLEMPFFLTAHGLSYFFGYDTDGYSKLYQVFINIAGIFYLFLGLWYLNLILKLYEITDKNRSFILVLAVFATNLFYYTVAEPGMSHVYSFALITLFIFYSKKFFTKLNKKYFMAMAILLAVIVLVRPINGLVVFLIPFLAGTYGSLQVGFKTLFKEKAMLILSAGMFFMIVSIQFIIYKISTENWFVYSYLEEGFNFFNPHFFDILFSYKKGLFIYTPIFLVSLVGLYYLYKQSKYLFFSAFLFLFLITYVFSSWWMWYYGGSFSSRVFVEYISFFMILLALSLNKIKNIKIKTSYVFLLVLLLIVCQIQTYQYRYFEIHWVDMNKEKYWDVFLRIDKLIK